MPGFQIAPSQESQVAPPTGVIYTYTWDIEQLVGEPAGTGALVYVKDVTLPSYKFDIDSINTGHADYEFAKGIKWQDVKVTFYDTDDLAHDLDIITEKVWSPKGGIKPANDYMADTKINVYLQTGELSYIWTLYNSWIKSLSYSNLTYESSGINNVIVTVSYSWAILTTTQWGVPI